MKQLFVILILFALVGCKATYPTATTTETTTTTREVPRMVEVVTPADTAKAVFSIAVKERENGQPELIIEPVSIGKGAFIKDISIRVVNGQLEVTAVAETQVIPVEVRDTFTETNTNTQQTTIVTTNELNVWQTFRLWIGNIVLFGGIGFVAFRLLQLKGFLNTNKTS